MGTNLAEMFLERSFLQNIDKILFHQKLWFLQQPNWNFQSYSLNIFSGFWNNFTWMFVGVNFFKNCLRNFDLPRNMAVVNGGRLALYGHGEILKTSQIQLVKFWNNFIGNFLDDYFFFFFFFQKCSQKIDLSINVVFVNGSYFHFTDIKKFSETAVRLWNNFAEKFFTWP